MGTRLRPCCTMPAHRVLRKGETGYSAGALGTDYQYTGQRRVEDIGLYFYNARWYDPALGRFAQADTIIPQSQGVQAWDRYAYVNNNPVRYTDPSGHEVCDEEGRCLNSRTKTWSRPKYWDHEDTSQEDNLENEESVGDVSPPSEKCKGLDVVDCSTFELNLTDDELYFWGNTLYFIATAEAVGGIVLGLAGGAGLAGAIYLLLESTDTAFMADYLHGKA